MAWYIYLIHFVTGFFLVNSIPHSVEGVCGRSFPTPFAKPPGRGKSSPVVNVLWGFFNFYVGASLLGLFWPQGEPVLFRWAAVGLGGLVSGLFLAKHFGSLVVRG